MIWHHRDDDQRTDIRLDEDGRLTLDREGYQAVSHVLSVDDALDLAEAVDRLLTYRGTKEQS